MRTAEEKAAVKQEKEAEKEKRAEEKRMQKEERRKSREAGVLAATAGAGAAVGAATPANITPANAATQARASTEEQNDDLYQDPTPPATAGHGSEPEHSNPTSPTSPASPRSESKVKSLLNKFKRRSKHSDTGAESDKPGFIGGAALRATSSHSRQDSIPLSPPPEPVEQAQSSQRRYSDVSSLSTGQEATEFEEARDEFDEKLAPPASYSTEADGLSKRSSNRDSKFHEVGI